MIDAQQYEELKNKGFTDDEIAQALQDNELNDSYDRAMQQQAQDPRSGASNTIIAGQMPNNVIEWQLELDSILERVEHLLRGDKPTYKNGSIVYVAPLHKEDYILNEYGIGEVMRILSLYINRNTILSNYDEATINWKVYDFGCDLADLFFLKYDEFGMNTPQKRKLYPILVRELVDTVHSAYLRALNGGERESIRKAISVNQNQNMGMEGQQPMGMMTRERSMLNPMRYISGKYK